MNRNSATRRRLTSSGRRSIAFGLVVLLLAALGAALALGDPKGARLSAGGLQASPGSGSAPGGSTPVSAHPNPARSSAPVRLSFMAPHLIDNNGDAYLVTYVGPGGSDCSRQLTYRSGVTWNPRYNSRHRRSPTLIWLGPQRTHAPSAAPEARRWCSGHFHGRIVFNDYPRGQRRGGHHSLSCSRQQVNRGVCVATVRLVSRFSFDTH